MLKTVEEILSCPEEGDTIQGRFIQKRSSVRYIFIRCPSCNSLRWVPNTVRELKHKRCIYCYSSNRERTPSEIVASPKVGDVLRATFLGYRGARNFLVWYPCNTCGHCRWIGNTASAKQQLYCSKCVPRYGSKRLVLKHSKLASRQHYHSNATGKFKTITATDLPKEGDLIRGLDIGRARSASNKIFRWTRCPSCQVGRWVLKSTPRHPRCSRCANEFKSKTYIGAKSSQWKSGRIGRRHGYFAIRVRPDSPYYPMVDHLGYVLEHRLVMAEHLGRCLSRSEIVHHCHTRFPAGSDEDRGDNRIENLKLVQHKDTHDAITSLERQVRVLKVEVEALKTKNKLNEWRIKELETTIQAYSQESSRD